MGDIPNRLSPVRNYVPVEAEEEESSSSQETASEPEATVEEGSADFFSNPSHRTTNPVLQQPVEPEEDRLILHLLRYLINHQYHSLIKSQGLKEDKDISKEEEKETEISIVTIAITSIKL